MIWLNFYFNGIAENEEQCNRIYVEARNIILYWKFVKAILKIKNMCNDRASMYYN